MSFEKTEIGPCTLYRGDCLEIIPTLAGVDAVIADPPYMLGAISAGDKKSKGGSLADLLNFSTWYALWIEQCKRFGPVAVFGNWRSISVYEAAFVKAGCKTYSCIVWDKEWIGPGQYFRPSWEMIMVGAAPASPPKIKDRALRDVIRCKWMAAHSGKGHPAEKPVEVMAWLTRALSDDGSTILDPFMGSGTTGVACIKTGRRFIGIEIDQDHFSTACRRIEAAWREIEDGRRQAAIAMTDTEAA